MKPGERQMSLPCVLHLPDMGTLRITCNVRDARLDYDARRFVKTPFVRIAFPAATATQPRVEYRLEVVAIHPPLPGRETNPLYDGFRRDWLNIFQVNPRVQMLANNASSDPCSFTLFEYSDLTLHTPPLAEGLTGWKSSDGQLHDYGFTYVQGLAITFGLLDDHTAIGVMDKLLAKMKEVGYERFDLGLPGNLVPVKKGDYVNENHPPEATGQPRLDDGSDGFQFYENGGATGCWAYYTVKTLYQLGRVEDARRIFHPMLAAYAQGKFQGFDASGRSRDWRDWKGGGHGYEGLLVDNYHALLGVLDDVKAKRP
jgi:hypothetical protein